MNQQMTTNVVELQSQLEPTIVGAKAANLGKASLWFKLDRPIPITLPRLPVSAVCPSWRFHPVILIIYPIVPE